MFSISDVIYMEVIFLTRNGMGSCKNELLSLPANQYNVFF